MEQTNINLVKVYWYPKSKKIENAVGLYWILIKKIIFKGGIFYCVTWSGLANRGSKTF